MSFQFEQAARLELLNALSWYLVDGGGLAVAEQFDWAVQRALDLLVFMPRIGRPMAARVRTWPLKRFPYTLVYRAEADAIVVIAVAHQSREPGYWKER